MPTRRPSQAGLDAELRAMQRELRRPEVRRRIEEALTGRTSVQLVKEVRREMEAEDARKAARRSKGR
jgi:hypothetical protein